MLLRLFCLMLVSSVSIAATTLDESFASALRNNNGAKQSHEAVVQSREQLSQAKGAIFPSINLKATYLKQPKPNNPLYREFSPDEQTTVNAELRQPLFRGFREFAGVRQRRINVAFAEESRVNSLLNLYQEVASQYYSILAMEQDLKNLNQQLDVYGTRVKELQGRIRRGESMSTEALTAQSTQAALAAEVQLVETNLQTERLNFQVMTGLPAQTQFVDIPAQKKAETLQPLQNYLDRIEERPDVKAAIDKVEASREEVRMAKGAHWPTLDLVGNYYFERPKGFLREIDWDVQLQFTMPLFEGGLRTSQTREAASKTRVSESELDQIRKQAEADIRSLYEALRLRENQLEALRKSSDLAEKNYQVVLRDNKRGLMRSTDVQVALTEYRANRRGYDQARYQAELDRIRLRMATAQYPQAVMKEEEP